MRTAAGLVGSLKSLAQPSQSRECLVAVGFWQISRAVKCQADWTSICCFCYECSCRLLLLLPCFVKFYHQTAAVILCESKSGGFCQKYCSCRYSPVACVALHDSAHDGKLRLAQWHAKPSAIPLSLQQQLMEASGDFRYRRACYQRTWSSTSMWPQGWWPTRWTPGSSSGASIWTCPRH